MTEERSVQPAPKSESLFFSKNIEDITAELKTSLTDGLSSAEAEKRIEIYGLNELQGEEKTPRWKVFLQQFQDILIYILIASALVSAVMEFIESHGESLGFDWLVIATIIILNAIIGFIQEGKADDAIEALKNTSAPDAQVIRDGKEVTVKAKNLVPGDIVILGEGDKIPADARLFDESNLKIEEAALTGESVPVKKNLNLLTDLECPLAERKNMVYASTLATYGRGKAIVTDTGMTTEVGKIAQMLSIYEHLYFLDSSNPSSVSTIRFGISILFATRMNGISLDSSLVSAYHSGMDSKVSLLVTSNTINAA